MPSDSSDDILRIFLATDLHLGFLENDPIRCDDSFIAFEEILQSAKDHKVDMIILGGDLFHINKPSRRTIWKTMKLLRQYCIGDGDIKFRIVSDQNQNFPNSFGGGVNYEDPNYNISIPVFSIHGNHDDPAGGGGLCALEILSMANLVNYFGKSESVDDVTIYPILFEKGITRFALYGLGYIRDERLHATFQERKVKFFRPLEDKNDWFSLFAIHQNRVSHDKKSYIDESMLDNFLDFILWGHEHECLIKPQQSAVGDFHICQPGAPITTSLCEAEAKQKFVGILEVKQNKFRLKEIPLKNVRPFVMDSIEMRGNGGGLGGGGVVGGMEGLETDSVDQVSDYLAQKIEELIDRAAELPYGKEMLPLIRLRVEHEGDVALPNPHRLSAMFVGRIANPNEVLLIKRKRPPPLTRPRRERRGDDGEMAGEMGEEVVMGGEGEEGIGEAGKGVEPKIGDVIESFIRKEMDRELCVHQEKELNFALSEFVDKLDPHSFEKCVKRSLSEAATCVEGKGGEGGVDRHFVMEILASRREGKEMEVGGEGEGAPVGVEGGKEELFSSPFLDDDDEEEEVVVVSKGKGKEREVGGGKKMQYNPLQPQQSQQQQLKKANQRDFFTKKKTAAKILDADSSDESGEEREKEKARAKKKYAPKKGGASVPSVASKYSSSSFSSTSSTSTSSPSPSSRKRKLPSAMSDSNTSHPPPKKEKKLPPSLLSSQSPPTSPLSSQSSPPTSPSRTSSTRSSSTRTSSSRTSSSSSSATKKRRLDDPLFSLMMTPSQSSQSSQSTSKKSTYKGSQSGWGGGAGGKGGGESQQSSTDSQIQRSQQWGRRKKKF